MKYLFLLCFTLMAIICRGQQSQIVEDIELSDFKSVITKNEVQIVDVRTWQEFEEGHIPKAININVKNTPDFKKRVQLLKKDAPVYLYCKSGGRSARAGKILRQLGFTRVYNYAGGWAEWSESNK